MGRGDLALGAGNQGLDDGTSVVVEEVDFVNDEKAHCRRHRNVPTFARDDVPLLGRGHYHLRFCDLLLGELHISGQLPHHQACIPRPPSRSP